MRLALLTAITLVLSAGVGISPALAGCGADPAAKAPAKQKFKSGLIMEQVREGEGERPKASDVVQVHYHGTFPDGKVFDSSVERGRPARFPLNRVIPCWTEGVQKIKVGGKAKLICPPEIAYGAAGAPPTIPANSTLHFEVELLAILR